MGRATYRSYCATCHGKKGKGDGPLAKHLRIPPTDVTTISQRNDGKFPFDKMVKIIDGRQAVRAHGSPDMPVWGDVFLKSGSGGGELEAQAKISQLTHFVWSIQEEGPPPAAETSEPPAAEPEPSEPSVAEPAPSDPPAPKPEPSEPPAPKPEPSEPPDAGES
jgi:hypothetical protein